MPSSPQVIIREEELVNIVPNVSTTITAIVGTAKKGELNTPTIVTSPEDYLNKFGEPTVNDYTGITALNFLAQGNQLYVVRVASQKGSDPVSNSTTDEPASIITNSITNPSDFSNKTVVLEINGETVTVNFQASISQVQDIVDVFNHFLGNDFFVPRLAYAEVVENNKIKITTQRADSSSYIKIVSATGLETIFNNIGQTIYGKRIVATAQDLQPAVLQSVGLLTDTIDTTYINGAIRSKLNPKGTLYNVSKQSKEAYLKFVINSLSGINVISWKRYNFRFKPVNIPANEYIDINIDTNAFNLQIGNGIGGAVPGTSLKIDTTKYSNDDNGRIALANDLKSKFNILPGLISDFPFVIESASYSNNDGYITVVFRQLDPTSNHTISFDKSSTWTSDSNYQLLHDNSNPAQNIPYDSKNVPQGWDYSDFSGNTSVTFNALINPSYILIDTTSNLITNSLVENAKYPILLGNNGADIDISNITSTVELAQAITNKINALLAYRNNANVLNFNYDPNYDPNNPNDPNHPGIASKQIAISASFLSNQVTLTTRIPLGAQGKNITFSFGGINLSVTDPPSGSNFAHGFDSRSGYNFASFEVDGVNYGVFDFDTVPNSVLPNKHEATIQQVASAINYLSALTSGEYIATAVQTTTDEYIVISSNKNGVEGYVKLISYSVNIGTGNDVFGTSGAVDLVTNTTINNTPYTSTGQGDNHITIVVDNSIVIDKFLPPNNALPLTSVAEILNNESKKYGFEVAQVTSQTQNNQLYYYLNLRSKNKGNFADFGAFLEVTNNLKPRNINTDLFPTITAQGTGNKTNILTFKAKEPGTWGNSLVVKISSEDQFAKPNSVKLEVSYKNRIVESYRELVLNPNDSNYIVNVINTNSKFITCEVEPDQTTTTIIPGTYTLKYGNDGMLGVDDQDFISGLSVLSDPDKIKFNVLAIPGITSESVQNYAIALAESRQDILVVLDPPLGLNTQEVIGWANGNGHGRTSALNSSFACVYNTWLKQFDSFNNVIRFVPPSAVVLPVLAFTDRVAEPWFAPAGINRGVARNVLDVVYNTSLGEREFLLGSGNTINPIVNFKGEGIFVWGDRTTVRKETPLKDIGVRRLVNFIKTSVSIIAKAILFEPNDPISVKKLIDTINPLLHNILTRRGVSDFKVADKTTDFDRDQGRMVINVLIKPIRSTQIIEIPLTITSQGVSL